MKVRSIRKGVEEVNAYCSDEACKFSASSVRLDSISKARSQARRHAEQSGHRVSVYVETRYVIKPAI